MPGLLASRMEAMLGDERFADVIVVLEGRRFPSHRAVLAAWSGFFSTMFGGGWAESAAREVTVELPARGFDDLLMFCYTGRVDLHKDNVSALLQLSAFLQVAELEELCCAFLLRPPDAAEPPAPPHLLQLLQSPHAESARLRELCVPEVARQLGAIADGQRGAAERAQLVKLPAELLLELTRTAAELPASEAAQPALLQLALDWAQHEARQALAQKGGDPSAWAGARGLILLSTPTVASSIQPFG